MHITINPKGNGACPLCEYNKKCNFHQILTKAFIDIKIDNSLQVVIYECPKFKFNESA